ncbi:Alpha/Beta hydrolase protein [Crucibulum laeve]|uniref:Alpha/Beta hydrolase protein n=1 Tax=Crucibulum laeve TaxID=68775 RepID=A0A5C3LG36_9AGAR|nr:Alpha/Beta hydrolase protein [Crucibulum laeve]
MLVHAVLAATLTILVTRVQAQAQQATFNWESLAPSDNLTWVECFSNKQCTRLNVPLNYSDPSAGTAVLAVIRTPSALNGTAAYGGPLLLNPGGPGGSGVDLIVSAGDMMAASIPEFDLVSFDPRGVGVSTPKISFFNTDIERAVYDFGVNAVDTVLNPDPVARQWAQNQVLGQLVKDRDNGFLAHVSTDNIARDMLHMVELHGDTKLQYWGISYGTVIGATFSAMFPDRVGRVIIDGVLDMEGYYNADWSQEGLDSDKTLQTFFDGCNQAGPAACAFYASSPQKIAQNLNDLYNAVDVQPVPAYSPSSNKYGTVDRATLRNALLSSMYTPYQSFSMLAQGLADLSKGNGSTIFQLSTDSVSEPAIAVACTDAVKITDKPDQLRPYAQWTSKISSFSSITAGVKIFCSGWQINPDHFRGPISGNTSFPLLVIGNTADPVTPLAA